MVKLNLLARIVSVDLSSTTGAGASRLLVHIATLPCGPEVAEPFLK